MLSFLLYTFGIAWSSEILLILIYKINLLHGVLAQVVHFSIIGFGAGMAPAYAAFIVKKKQNGVTLKSFCRDIFHTENIGKCFMILILFAAIQFFACFLQERYLNYPWYYFILFMPMMILGGGLEEIGWQGIFQPLLQKRLPFLIAAIIEGVVWSIWHLPLWFVPNTSQSAYSFTAFTLYCITLGTTLAAAHRITQSIWVSVLLHAWGNTVLGGMYSLTSLCNFPDLKTLFISAVQMLFIMGILLIYNKTHNRRLP